MEYEEKERHEHHPWLLITDGGEQNEKQYVYSISENRLHPYHLAPSELHEKNILASAYGWLVLTDPNTFHTFIWNPISNEKIDLGLLDVSYVYNKCVMSKPPSEPDCHLVLFSTDGFFQAYFRLVGDDDDILSHPMDHDNHPKLLAAEAFRGTIYGFIHPGFRFVIVHFGEEGSVEYRPILKGDQLQQPWDLPNNLPWEPLSYMDYYMIESQEELLLVYATRVSIFVPEELDFKVFRVDVDRKECVELDNIGDRGIFISFHGSGFCCSSSSGFRLNCIYYTIEKKDENESRCVFVYDLNNRSTCSLLPCPDASPTQTQCYWVENQVFASIKSP